MANTAEVVPILLPIAHLASRDFAVAARFRSCRWQARQDWHLAALKYTGSMRILRWTLGISLLLFQLGAIAYARFVPARYFCWAPFDMQTSYQLNVIVNGQPLTAKQVQERYRRPQKGFDNRSVQHLIDILEQTEERYYPDDDTRIIMTYRINGKEEERWEYRSPR